MSTDPTIEAARVEGFNTLHSIGTPVRYWKGAREGDGKVSRTRAAAQLLSGHTAVVWLENVAGCIALTHVQTITEGEFTATPAEQWPAAATGRSFRTYLDREERDQLDARAAAAEAERDEARDERDELNQKIHAMRAALGYLPTADPIQCAIQTAEALAEARQRIDALDAEATRWKTRLVHDTARLREHLDRANTERQQLAAELATMTDVARSNKQHVAGLAAIVGDIEQLATLWSTATGDGAGSTTRRAAGEDLFRVLNAPASPVRPADHPHEDPGGEHAHTYGMKCPVSDCRWPMDPSSMREQPRPGSSRRAQDGHAQGYAEAVARLRDDERYRDWWTSDGVKPDGPIRQHLADYLETVGPDGVDVETGRWPAREQAVIRAAIAWRKRIVSHPNLWADDQDFALIEAVDALPHIGETARPRIVVLCGSTRFRTEIADANRRFTLDGYIVLAPGVFGHDGDQVTDEQKEALDDLHFRKIELADEVYVVNPDGYIGESTRLEMSYARRTGKPVRRLVESRVTLPTYGDDAPGTLRSRP